MFVWWIPFWWQRQKDDKLFPISQIRQLSFFSFISSHSFFTGNNNGPPKINIKPPVGFSSPRRGSRRGSSWDDTIFDEIIRGKKQSLGDGYFDDAGVWVPGLKPFRSHESLNDDSFGRSFLRGPGLFSRKRKESNDKERSSSIKAGKPTAKSNTEVTGSFNIIIILVLVYEI